VVLLLLGQFRLLLLELILLVRKFFVLGLEALEFGSVGLVCRVPGRQLKRLGILWQHGEW